MPAQLPAVAYANAGIAGIFSAKAAASAASELTGNTVAAKKLNSMRPGRPKLSIKIVMQGKR